MSDVIGSGSDTLVFQMSEDSGGTSNIPNGNAEFTVNVDGQQIGGLQTVTASHADGQTQPFTFEGNFAPGPHQVTVTFANNNGTTGDKAAENLGDRNLYVNSFSYDGQTVSDSTVPIYTSPEFPPNNTNVLIPGNAVFNVNDTTPIPADAPSTPSTTPGPVDYGSGPDTLSLQMSEDPYQGDAQFTVAVDGQQVGGTFTTTAIKYEGQQQTFNLSGDWGPGAHTVTVDYLSNRNGPTDAQGNAYDGTDQNLYVNGLSYDGVQGTGAPWELATNGPQNFSIPAGGQPTSATTTPPTTTDSSTTGATTTDSSNQSSGSAGSTTTDQTGTSTTTPSGTQTPNQSGSTAPTGSGNGDNATITPDTLNANGSPPSAGGNSSTMSFVSPPDQSGASSGASSTSSTNSTNANWWSNADSAPPLGSLAQGAPGGSDWSAASLQGGSAGSPWWQPSAHGGSALVGSDQSASSGPSGT